MDHAVILRVLPGFKELVRSRKTKDGFAWYDDKDVERLRAKEPTLGRSELALLAKRVGQETNLELDQRSDGERLQTMIDLLKMTNGELTEEARRLYNEKYGPVYGPVIRSAREHLGLKKPAGGGEKPEEPEGPKASPEILEALNMVGAVERLQRKVAEIDVEIEKLENEKKRLQAEIDVYKPVLGHLRAFQSAVAGVKNKIGEMITQERNGSPR
jgi:DNA repair exonuclease SbcCD ATPase subunit